MSIYDYSFKSAKGQEISFAEYQGKVLLIVNTASRCGLADQFAELEMLHKKYADQGLAVIGFPCAQFLNQEPETNDTVEQYCLLNFGVTYLLSEKINVNGKHTHPVFAYLKESLPAGLAGKAIKWNFTKFLIDRNGAPYKRYEPKVSPLDMEQEIINLLAQPQP